MMEPGGFWVAARADGRDGRPPGVAVLWARPPQAQRRIVEREKKDRGAPAELALAAASAGRRWGSGGLHDGAAALTLRGSSRSSVMDGEGRPPLVAVLRRESKRGSRCCSRSP